MSLEPQAGSRKSITLRFKQGWPLNHKLGNRDMPRKDSILDMCVNLAGSSLCHVRDRALRNAVRALTAFDGQLHHQAMPHLMTAMPSNVHACLLDPFWRCRDSYSLYLDHRLLTRQSHISHVYERRSRLQTAEGLQRQHRLTI